MRRAFLFFELYSFCFCGFIGYCQVSGTGNGFAADEHRFRAAALDLAFTQKQLRGTGVVLTLRWLPSFHPESQVTIQRFGANTQVTYYRASVPFETAVKAGGGSTARTADALQVSELTVPINSAIGDRWFEDFWTAVETTLGPFRRLTQSSTVQLDGTTYVCSFSDGIRTINLELQGSEERKDRNADLPMVRFMNSVRDYVDIIASSTMPNLR